MLTKKELALLNRMIHVVFSAIVIIYVFSLKHQSCSTTIVVDIVIECHSKTECIPHFSMKANRN